MGSPNEMPQLQLKFNWEKLKPFEPVDLYSNNLLEKKRLKSNRSADQISHKTVTTGIKDIKTTKITGIFHK